VPRVNKNNYPETDRLIDLQPELEITPFLVLTALPEKGATPAIADGLPAS
jgi:hypothetical protein